MAEKVLAVGGGGREHAIVDALARSGADVYAVMKNRNPGIARLAKDFKLINETDVSKVVQYARESKVGLAIVGPEAPLQAGLSDALRAEGIGVVGPSKKAARMAGRLSNKSLSGTQPRAPSSWGLPHAAGCHGLAGWRRALDAFSLA